MTVIALLALLLGSPQGSVPDVQSVRGVVRDQTGASRPASRFRISAAVASTIARTATARSRSPRSTTTRWVTHCRSRCSRVIAGWQTHYEGQIHTKVGKKTSIELDADGSPIKK